MNIAALSQAFKDPWELFGLSGQLLFGTRFLYQWYVSERLKKSVVPKAFWWISLIAAFILLVYAIHKESLPFVLAAVMGMPVYYRNIALLRIEKKQGSKAPVIKPDSTSPPRKSN
ncbi:MAG: lipid-A-disaccharide synthase N-terminal domain-containing protein [bacterium]